MNYKNQTYIQRYAQLQRRKAIIAKEITRKIEIIRFVREDMNYYWELSDKANPSTIPYFISYSRYRQEYFHLKRDLKELIELQKDLKQEMYETSVQLRKSIW